MSGRLREKEGLSAGKGAGNALTIGSADVNYTSYTEYGLWSMEYRDERKKKVWIYLHICYLLLYVEKGVVGLFTLIVEWLSLPYWLGFGQFNYQLYI